MRINNSQESLDLNIKRDSTTHFPLYEERHKIMQLINTYLPLPYSIVEYGCGKKCSIILNRLIKLGIPAYAIRRGMIMEKNMSEEQLKEEDHTKREEPLTIHNLLYFNVDFNDKTLLDMLDSEHVSIDKENSVITAGEYKLHHRKRVQFIKARSHIVPMITFWDENKGKTVELVMDPTVDDEKLFKVEKLREALQAPEAHIYTAHVLARFEFEEEFLTENHKHRVKEIIGDKPVSKLARGEYFDLIRKMNHSEKGSIGDPVTWTYANNLHSDDSEHHNMQLQVTGMGENIKDLYYDMIKARNNKNLEEVIKIRSKLNHILREKSIYQTIKNDANWSEKKMVPLAIVANTISYHRAIKHLHHWVRDGHNLFEILNNDVELHRFHGLGVLLRERIESLAQISKNKEDEIDARALSPLYFDACLLTIKQMRKAGMTVFVDKAGNIHGLMIKDKTRKELKQEKLNLKDITKRSVCHCSHIDTVSDAGKYDGRLGVLSGILCAQVLFDLRNHFDHKVMYTNVENPIMVTAFIGEEMTFTGNDVAMPGSAAVSGQAKLEQIYNMHNSDGEKFITRLKEFIAFLKEATDRGEIELFNDFSKEGSLDQCFEPTDFLTQHTYERHIEQGPVLDRHVLPLVEVENIMGIHQEDFTFNGKDAELAALSFNQKIRKLYSDDGTEDIRVTVGIIRSEEEDRNTIPVKFGMRWKLEGQKNHAGATLLIDRKDPGIAAGRLADKFIEIVKEANKANNTNIKPIIGAVELVPGFNRNVIPAESYITLGISSSSEIDKNVTLKIEQELKSFIIHKLSLSVEEGGEGVNFCSVDLVDFLNKPNKVRLSLDLRGKTLQKIGSFQEKINECSSEISRKYEIDIDSSLEQNLQPYSLRKTGQVLQLERSFGGSHNPNEAELANDLLRGSMLQLGITMEVMHMKEIDRFNLFELTEQKIPEEWRDKISFTSGALHDTCNIAAAFVRRKVKT